VAAWHSGNVVWHFDKATVHQAQLVLGWVTVFDWHTTLVSLPSYPDQLSLLHSAVLEVGTGQRAVMLCGWRVKAGMAHCNCG